MDGVIKNLSGDGAKIVFPQALRIPDTFGLEIKRMQRGLNARIIWRSGTAIGVNFVATDKQPNATPLDLVRHLKERAAAKVARRRRDARASLREGSWGNSAIPAP
jgi:hypothetical protein